MEIKDDNDQRLESKPTAGIVQQSKDPITVLRRSKMYKVMVLTFFVSQFDGCTNFGEYKTLKGAMTRFNKICEAGFPETYSSIDDFIYENFEEDEIIDEFITVLQCNIYNEKGEWIVSRNFDYNSVSHSMDEHFEIDFNREQLTDKEIRTLKHLGYSL